MKNPSDQWNDLPDIADLSATADSIPQLGAVFPASPFGNDSFNPMEVTYTDEFGNPVPTPNAFLPPDPIGKLDFEIKHRPGAQHWPAPFQAKLRLPNGPQKVFYGVSVNSVMDQMRQEVE